MDIVLYYINDINLLRGYIGYVRGCPHSGDAYHLHVNDFKMVLQEKKFSAERSDARL